MTDPQPAVDAIRAATKAEKRIRYTLKTPKYGKEKVLTLTFPDIEQGPELRYFLRRNYTVIAREIIDVIVGTTPVNEEHMGGYSE